MELAFLLLGVALGFGATIRLTQRTRDAAWRAWFHDPHQHLAPDGLDFWGRRPRRRRFEVVPD